MKDAKLSEVQDFIRHLASRKLSDNEIILLKELRAFYKENQGSLPDRQDSGRYCISQLYPPLKDFRKMGLPLIASAHPWQETSEEGLNTNSCRRTQTDAQNHAAQLLLHLGLRPFPPLKMVIDLASCSDPGVRESALVYLLGNITFHYSGDNLQNFSDIAYVPARDSNGECIAKPKEVSFFHYIITTS
jgi:hypothetical protein